jgi:ribosomal protein S18 acetylase RimI-like enzyme
MRNRARHAPAPTGTESGRERAIVLPVEIREMEIEDLAAVFALGERLFRAGQSRMLHRTWDEYEVIDYFSSDREYCLVAEHREQIVGFVIGTIIEKRRSAWTYGYLVWICVEPEVAGRGVAHRLAARLTDLFIDAGARMMLADTEADNAEAIEFLQREGFGQRVPHLYLTKNLTSLPGYRRRRKAPDVGPGSR